MFLQAARPPATLRPLPTQFRAGSEMSSHIFYYFNMLLRYFDRFNEGQWLWLLLGLVVFGLYCMRGFGSRSQY